MPELRRYGCFDRPPYRAELAVQDGWLPIDATDHVKSRLPRIVTVPVPMTKDCQYSKTTPDVRCDGCRWRHQEAA